MNEKPQECVAVDEAVARLCEHWETVRIFVSAHRGADSETDSYDFGAGNFLAQKGQIQEWVQIQSENVHNYIRRKHE